MDGEATGAAGLKDDIPVLGHRNYWYPIIRSRRVGRKPVHVKLLGDDIVLFRDTRSGKVAALAAFCPHRGAPLWQARVEFPGTISCSYHGWTFDGEGRCRAALSEGPDSPIARKARARTYPAHELHGAIWLWMGEGEAVPIEDDLPSEFFDPRIRSMLAIQQWDVNWRITLENPGDSHPAYLHRTSALTCLTDVPAWMKLKVDVTDNAIVFNFDERAPYGEYPGLGKWPRTRWFRVLKGRTKRYDMRYGGERLPYTELRLPGIARVDMGKVLSNRYAVPVDANTTRHFTFNMLPLTGPNRWWKLLTLWAWYYAWYNWAYHWVFLRQDKRLLEKLDYAAPERLSATDRGMIQWRMLSRRARGATPPRSREPRAAAE